MVRGWLGKTLLGLLLIPFALVGIESYFEGGKEVVVAEVDGREISRTLLDKAFDNQRQQLQARLGPDASLTPAQQKQLRERVLNSLVQRELLLASAKDAGYRVSDAALQQLIQETPTFQENGRFSQARYVQVLSQIGESPTTFPNRAREEILTSQRVTGLLQSAFVTPVELDQLGGLDSQLRDVSYVLVPAARHLAAVSADDAEIKAAYDKDSQRFMQPEQVSVSYIQLKRDAFLAAAKVTPEALQARYDERVKAMGAGEERRASHILIAVNDKSPDAAARKRIDELAGEVAKGADFATLAKASSQDPGSAVNGGDLGFASRGMFVPEFEKALFSLAKPGDVSAVVKSPFGYHLIKLTEIKQANVPSFATLRPELEKEVRMAQADEAYTQAAEKLDSALYEAGDLSEPARAAGLAVTTTPLFDRKGGDGLIAERKIIEAAFSDDLVKDGKNSGAIGLRDGSTVWLRVARHLPARKLPLAEVREVIAARVKLDKALAKSLADAEALVKASATQPLAAAAQAAGLSSASQADVGRQTPMPSAQLLREAFRAPHPVQGKAQAIAVKLGEGAAVIMVTAVKPGAALAGQQRKATQAMLAENRGQQELQDVLGYLRAKAKVEIKSIGDSKVD